MNQTIIREITNLKRNYNNDNNTYEINYLDITEDNFLNKLKNVFKQVWDSVKIIDNKEYIQRDLTLSIDGTGAMECLSRKMLKYRIFDEVRINLFNERKINTDNFGGSSKYDKVYKQKMMIFTKDEYKMILVIKTDLDKNTTYEIKILFKSRDDEKYLTSLFQILE